MKRAMPWSEQVDVISSSSSDDDSSSDSDVDVKDILHPNGVLGPSLGLQSSNDIIVDEPIQEMSPKELLFKRAEMYQEYMRQIPIPTHRGSIIPFTSWMGLGKSIKELYKQPLHYLTNILLKKWDLLRIGSEDEHTPLDIIIHPSKAEAVIWINEEIHRRISSHHQIIKLWLSDPIHDAFIDSVVP